MGEIPPTLSTEINSLGCVLGGRTALRGRCAAHICGSSWVPRQKLTSPTPPTQRESQRGGAYKLTSQLSEVFKRLQQHGQIAKLGFIALSRKEKQRVGRYLASQWEGKRPVHGFNPS